ncbi:gliding motility-associated C-terminal domain-containing protein [Arenibacter nanhaiticus]|uniref:Gliding motility-associated C-terminal domain-containing protein n=1 Tax=Arenibacter nanhaiticus TaxID=558155 RepID=A0A1M6H6S9_9FLAO|nr:gliding motility-associated C-terminal domain-containing protein [Arenibacter nanhaiticus]SHJ17941.1 gliding motility-associated C-terminal domain-containing protein [Arenibacter nanhaiticus]
MITKQQSKSNSIMNTIKYIVNILLFASAFYANCQEAVHNYGSIQIHETAMVGFHMDIINDGTFDENKGLVGFYNEDNALTISGAFAPIFDDLEVAITDGLYLETSMGVNNNLNFVDGNIFTPKNRSDIVVRFFDQAFYVGDGIKTKIEGYATAINKDTFTFPVGDDDRIRPMTVISDTIIPLSKCAYFFEDPNGLETTQRNNESKKLDFNVKKVSSKEYWRLEGDNPVQATLSWDTKSNIGSLGEYLSDLIVVGWRKKDQKWQNLGNAIVEGEIGMGSITSNTFLPNDYELITIGGILDLNEVLTTIDLGNYFLTPNGDGKNDFLVLDGITESPNNLLQIFNRFGVLVYSKANYNNEFNGLSNQKTLINGDRGLSSGVYFYILTLHDLKIKHQGYMYISQKATP